MISTKIGRLLEPVRTVPPAAERFLIKHGLPFDVRSDYSADATLRSIGDSL